MLDQCSVDQRDSRGCKISFSGRHLKSLIIPTLEINCRIIKIWQVENVLLGFRERDYLATKFKRFVSFSFLLNNITLREKNILKILSSLSAMKWISQKDMIFENVRRDLLFIYLVLAFSVMKAKYWLLDFESSGPNGLLVSLAYYKKNMLILSSHSKELSYIFVLRVL